MTNLPPVVRANVDRATAIRRLTNRWHEQCERWPTMCDRIPLQVYIERNIQAVMNGACPLESYDRR